MNRDHFASLKRWFIEYVSGFYTDDPNYNLAIRLKEEHSKRVCDNIVLLGKALDLSEQNMMLAKTTALFHDIGRFKQYAIYRTFRDTASENHARLGLRQITIRGILSGCAKDEQRIITRAIAHHNAAALPKAEDEKTLLFMRLIRDADKLDIWKVVTDYYHESEKQPNPALELDLPDDPRCSHKAIEALNKHRIVRMQDVRTLNDFKLLQISWVFDLNFALSFELVKSSNYLGQIEETLPGSKRIKEAVMQAHDYVNAFKL